MQPITIGSLSMAARKPMMLNDKKLSQAGFWKCYYRLRFKGYSFNHKRIYRVYCRLGLNLKCRIKKTLPEREKNRYLCE